MPLWEYRVVHINVDSGKPPEPATPQQASDHLHGVLSPDYLQREGLASLSLLLLCLYLGAYHGLFAALGGALWRRGGPFALLGLPALWVALEWLRAHLFSGFPWNLAAYAWTDLPGALPTAAWIGAYGATGSWQNGDNSTAGSEDDENRLGASLGAMAQSDVDAGPDVAPTKSDLATARTFGAYVARCAQRWAQ